MDKRVVLFDFDGVIADTEESNAQYLETALSAFGIRISDQDKRSLIGTNDKDRIAGLLSGASGVITLEEFALKRREVGNTYENSDISPMPGLIPLILDLRSNGIKTGLVTATSTRLIITALNRMKMMDLFDVIVCGDMCRKAKPDPEGYTKAMGLLGAEPGECIVFEDSFVGIHAAKLSGARVIAYTGAGVVQDTGEADMVLDSYTGCIGLVNEMLLKTAGC